MEPIICETCFGDDTSIQVTKEGYDSLCKVCIRPFAVSRLTPSHDSSYKNTKTCWTCSKKHNVCQICVAYLKNVLPAQAPDTTLALNSNGVIPKSARNKEYFEDNHEQRRATSENIYESSYAKAPLSVCSLFLQGECTRGSGCPYLHKYPIEQKLSQQNVKDGYYGVNDLVQELQKGAGENQSLAPPEDKSIKTLYVFGLDERVRGYDLTKLFYSQGDIESIRMLCGPNGYAIVTFKTREGAEKTAKELSNIVINGVRLVLVWGYPKAQEEDLLRDSFYKLRAHSSRARLLSHL